MNANATPDPQGLLRLENQLCFPLYAASNLITRAYRPLLQPLGLTYPQYLVMMVLWEVHSISVGELGQKLYLDSGTLTPMLKRMEQNGLVQRLRDPADERRVSVSLTQAGIDLKEPAASIPANLGCKVDGSREWLKGLRLDLQKLISLIDP